MASDINLIAISCLCCHNAPAAMKRCGWGRRERVHQISFLSPLKTPFLNLEKHAALVQHFFFFWQNLLSTKKQIHVAWDILRRHVDVFWIFEELVRNTHRMCLYLKQQFCEAGENSVNPAIFSSLESAWGPSNGFIKAGSRRAASPSWLSQSRVDSVGFGSGTRKVPFPTQFSGFQSCLSAAFRQQCFCPWCS